MYVGMGGWCWGGCGGERKRSVGWVEGIGWGLVREWRCVDGDLNQGREV